MADLFESVKDLKSSNKEARLFGSLGIPINGKKTVEVPTRSGFVYVRLRDSTSEIIQAQNDTVSPIYDLPVELVRRGNKYAIKGRDTERYQDWGTYSSFLPRHGEQHSFNPEAGGGGDVTFIFGKQFMPMLTMPSGSVGAGNVVLSEYVLQDTTVGWKYTGNTGTQNILGYKPLDGNAVMVLVYVDQSTGNPGILVGSGSYFSNAITGTAQVLPYIPPITNTNFLPSFAVRLSSGTSVIGWENLYDVRQYYGVGSSITGSSSGGGLSGISVQDEGIPIGTGTVFNFVGSNVDVSLSGTVIRVFVTGSSASIPTFITGSIPYAGSNGVLKEDNRKLMFDEVLGVLWLGGKTSINASLSGVVMMGRPSGTNSAVGLGMLTVGTGTSGSPVPFYNGYRARGTYENPTAIQRDDGINSMVGFGFDGSDWIPAARIRMYANSNWNGSNTETRLDLEITPSGSTTRRVGASLYGDSFNLPFTGTYNVNGIPHTHSTLIPVSGWIEASDSWAVQTQAYTNDPAAGASITLNMTNTSKFAVDDTVIVSSSAGDERALVTAVVLNTSITVDRLQLNHTTTSPLVISTKVTANSGADVIYTPGTKIRLKQGGSYKYFYVIDNTSTLVSLQAGDDYYLTNVAITDIAYSYIENPVGFPPIFSWTPFNTGFSAQPTGTYKFKLRGGLVSLFVSLAAGTSNATTFNIPVPFAFVGIGSSTIGLTLGGVDNGVSITAPGRVIVITNNSLRIDKAFGTANGWTASGGKSTAFAVETPYR